MEQGHNRQDNLSLIIQVVLNCENKNRQRNKNKLYKQPSYGAGVSWYHKGDWNVNEENLGRQNLIIKQLMKMETWKNYYITAIFATL